jgi:hypothetical protein
MAKYTSYNVHGDALQAPLAISYYNERHQYG